MSLQIRHASLESDRRELIELTRRHLAPRSDERRYEWLYCNSPFGAARAWVVCDDGGAIVGGAAAFPRKMYFGGIERMGWVLGDFWLERKYRSLGPALQLQRACLGAAGEAPFIFCFDFPSQSMMAVYTRLRIPRVGTLVRWARPMRIDRRLHSAVRSDALSRALGAIGSTALAMRGWKGRRSACDLDPHQGACGEEFDSLDRQLRSRSGVQTVRSAEYLNWRYLAQPGATHEFLTARRRGELIGYAIFARDSEDANIVDLSSVDEPDVIARLLAGVADLLRARGVTTLSMCAGHLHPWTPVFERAGFLRREEVPVVAYAPESAALTTADFQRQWYLMQGDRDS